MAKVLLTGIAALFLATGTAHAMDHDLSNTWCARHSGEHGRDRTEYYAWIDKCHRRRGTKPCYGNIGKPEDVEQCAKLEKRSERNKKDLCEKRCNEVCQLGHKPNGAGYWFCEAPKQ